MIDQLVSVATDEYRLLSRISTLRRKGKRITVEVVNTTDDVVETFGFE